MRWRRDWYERPPRPKVRRLKGDEQQQLLTQMTRALARSPVLSAFGIRVRFLRGRFYVERPTAERVECWGRITPVSEGLLLEVKYGSWKEITRGSPQKLINTIAADTKGTFHGLGSLDQSLRKAGQGLTRLPVKHEGGRFVYADAVAACSVQEALFHFFGLGVEVIAEPATWYSYHRTPHIIQFTEDRKRVLVRFLSSSWSGQSFGGTCLYALHEGTWGACTIRPSESDSIATAEAWLIKRKWKAWC
jgi:hypothetical protein